MFNIFSDPVKNDKYNAYIGGLIAAKGEVYSADNSKIQIQVKKSQLKFAELLSYPKVSEKVTYNEESLSFIINIHPESFASLQNMLEDHHASTKWLFLRGYFDACGFIESFSYSHIPKAFCYFPKSDDAKFFARIVEVPCSLDEKTVVISGTNALDFLGRIYDHNCDVRLEQMYDKYIAWLGWGAMDKQTMTCRIFRTDPHAILPSKTRESDVGYDLTVIKKHKQLRNNVALYDTGIKVQVPYGFYVEVLPRSSLSKSGYVLANSVGIIDPSYTGNIYIALAKIDENAPDIEYPFRCCQMILRQQHHVNIVEATEDFEETDRAAGGFGSTNTK